MNDVAKVVPQEPQAESVSVMQVIARAATDPRVDVAKMSALLDMQERITAKQAEIEFNRAFTIASRALPRIVKNGSIEIGRGKITFAKYEDVDSVVKPIEAMHGFTRSFSSLPTKDGVLMVVKLRHDAGHSETSTMQLPPDSGPGRNGLQAIGSSRAYGKRYLTLDIWNIVTVGADDDANAVGFITDAQLSTLCDMLAATGLDRDEHRKAKFLEFAGAKSVSEIKAANYDKAIIALRAELKKRQQG